jgi:hypothetical protein
VNWSKFSFTGWRLHLDDGAIPRVAGTSQIVPCDRLQAESFALTFTNCPDHLEREAVSPNSAQAWVAQEAVARRR